MVNRIEDLELNAFEKVLSKIFKRYTYKIYRNGVEVGYNWAKNNKFI